MVAEGAVGGRGTVGVLLCTATATHFTSLNGEWERDLGWTKEELTSRPFADFIHPNDRDRTLAEWAKVGSPGYEVVDLENRFRARGGQWRWLRWTARADGAGWVAAAIDVTSERQLEPRLDPAGSGVRAAVPSVAAPGGDVVAPPSVPYRYTPDRAVRLVALRVAFAVTCLVAILLAVRGTVGPSASGPRFIQSPELLPHMSGPVNGAGPIYTLGGATNHPSAVLGPRPHGGPRLSSGR